MTIDPFLAHARQTYADANAGTLRWMLARPPLGGAFLNTKQRINLMSLSMDVVF